MCSLSLRLIAFSRHIRGSRNGRSAHRLVVRHAASDQKTALSGTTTMKAMAELAGSAF
jgi:hypothetical protein